MRVRLEAFLDRSEPNDDGSYDHWYEGEDVYFEFGGGRSLRARRYVDTPTEAALFFSDVGPTEDDAETRQAVEWLREAGAATVSVLGAPDGGYRPLRGSP
jgi:phospholipase/lecithinase/hemolysin